MQTTQIPALTGCTPLGLPEAKPLSVELRKLGGAFGDRLAYGIDVGKGDTAWIRDSVTMTTERAEKLQRALRHHDALVAALQAALVVADCHYDGQRIANRDRAIVNAGRAALKLARGEA